MRINTLVDAFFVAEGPVSPISQVHGFDKGFVSDPTAHPLWVFDTAALQGPELIFCTIVLAFAGVLCSAGGIGGGGVYVTVLMVAGALSPHDAVPLSKAIVFFGSLSSLLLNLRKQTASDNTRKALIDYNICRLVVPASLIGTLLGVMLNRYTSGSVIVFVLSAILVTMSFTTTRTAYNQYIEEERNELEKRRWEPGVSQAAEEGSGDSPHVGSGGSGARMGGNGSADATAGQSPDDATHELQVQAFAPDVAQKPSAKHSATATDVTIGLVLLLAVVSCGVLRFHADACGKSVHQSQVWSTSNHVAHACRHPIVSAFGLSDSLERSMSGPDAGQNVFFGVLFFPFVACLAAMVHYGRACAIYEAWPTHEVLKYQAVSACTGCLAGLVGIGGGLIFSPFFLLMGVEPAVAVATSSTCVIFTSSSTTFQYLLTDRIIISLTLVYGLVNLVASYAGTSLVHVLQDRLSARKSCITAIVAAGVLVSAVLSVAKLVSSEGAVRH